MGYRYTYSTILSTGAFTKSLTSPHVCEYPLVSTEKFRGMRRAIRIRPDSHMKYERNFSRMSESMESMEIYEMLLIMPSVDDLNNLIEDIRNIHINKTDATYNMIGFISEVKIEILQNTKVFADVGVACRKAGKVRT